MKQFIFIDRLSNILPATRCLPYFIKKGDKILTRGGLYGKIVNFQGKNDNKIVIDAGSGVKLNVARSYIAGLANNQNDTDESN